MSDLDRRFGVKGWADVAWLVGVSAFVILSIGFLLYALGKYPLLDGNDPIYLRAIASTMAIVCLSLWLARRRIFTGDARQPLLMWVLIFGAGIPIAAAVTGAVLFVNGALDRGRAVRRATVVVSEADEPRNRHYMLAFADTAHAPHVKLTLTAREPLVVPVGGQVILEVMPGRLERPWVRAHIP